ncbi:hypothetical protein VTO42DRAFT_8584 [Malbranchea cinnamomea]
MFTFTPLLGAQSSRSKASQSILELDGGIKILVDVGWDETFDTSALVELERHIPTLSLILLTHATPSHLGAFVHCCRVFPQFTQIPVYATSPVIAFGRSLLQELYASAPLAATFLPTSSVSESSQSASTSSGAALAVAIASQGNNAEPNGTGRILLPPPTTEEIARYFSLIHPLKYSQPHQPLPSPFSPPLNGLTLTAYNAGHTVGGTIWHIQHGMESIVYAVDWNQARENVVAGAAWFGGSVGSGTEVIEQLRKPTALVCSANGGDKFALAGGRRKRDDLLLEMIRSSIAKGGTVLIPTDTSARVLELAYVLEHAWRELVDNTEGENPFKNASLYLACKKAHGTMRLARSMLEWMDESIVREFEGGEGGDARQSGKTTSAQGADKKSGASAKNLGPFSFKHLKLVERRAKLEKVLESKTPQVILASDTSLEWGFSKQALRHIAQGPENLIILTESFVSARQSGGTGDEGSGREGLGQTLWNWYQERRDGVALEKASDGELLEQVHTGGREVTITDVQKAPLDSNDVFLYQQYLATQRQLQNTAQARSETNLQNAPGTLDDEASSTSSEESESEQQGKVLNFSTSLAHSTKSKIAISDADLGVNILLRRKNVYDYDVRGKKGRERMFPYVQPRKRGDQYGEFIRPEEYLRAEEREEAQVQGQQKDATGRTQTKPGQKRRWGEVGGAEGKQSGPNKRTQVSQGDKDVETDVPLPEALDMNGTNDGDVSEEEEPEEQAVEGPSKATLVKSTLKFHARLAFVDFAGVHDKRSLEMLIPLIHPRKLILVGGMKDETLSLAAECRKLLAAKVGVDVTSDMKSVVDIFTPVEGETVDASVDTNAWMVKISRPLFRQLKWQNVRSLGVVALTGRLRGPDPTREEEDDEPAKKKLQLVKDDSKFASGPVKASSLNTKNDLPLLDVLPPNLVAATRSVTRPLHVGDLRLTDLRKLMQAEGHTAEFRGEGTLLVDGFVVVRKSGAGKIEIEGAARAPGVNLKSQRFNENIFLTVKRKVFDCLAIVAGG